MAAVASELQTTLLTSKCSVVLWPVSSVAADRHHHSGTDEAFLSLRGAGFTIVVCGKKETRKIVPCWFPVEPWARP